MKVLTSIEITTTNYLRLETIQRYLLSRIHKFIINPVIKFWRFSVYYGTFIANNNYPEQQ